MKRELTFQLLRSALPDPPWTDDRLQNTLQELRILAEHKYNKYEMYQPARLFFESLYLLLAKLQPDDRTTAMEFVRKSLLFVSREEFQQLAHILYHDGIRQTHLNRTSILTGIPRYKIAALCASDELKRVQRSSLYVALSDGARIDYFRRQMLTINNEQVVTAYYVGDKKAEELTRKLGEALHCDGVKFESLYLIDDFCGSGRTLLREVVTVPLRGPIGSFAPPDDLKARLQYVVDDSELNWDYAGDISSSEEALIRSAASGGVYSEAVSELVAKARDRNTVVKGALKRLTDSELFECVDQEAQPYLCPLLITDFAKF